MAAWLGFRRCARPPTRTSYHVAAVFAGSRLPPAPVSQRRVPAEDEASSSMTGSWQQMLFVLHVQSSELRCSMRQILFSAETKLNQTIAVICVENGDGFLAPQIYRLLVLLNRM
jgi:hypothetical protein